MRGKRFGRKKNSKSGAFEKRYRRRHSNRHAQDGILEAYVGTTDVYHHQKSKWLQAFWFHILLSVYSLILWCVIVSSFNAIPTKSGNKTIAAINHNKDRRSMSSIKNNSSLCKSSQTHKFLKRFYYFSAVTHEPGKPSQRFDDEQDTKGQRSHGKEYHSGMDRY